MAATSSPEPKLIAEFSCSDKEWIYAQIKVAMAGIVVLHGRELDAAFAGNLAEMKLIVEELQLARERKEELLAAFTDHVLKHGC